MSSLKTLLAAAAIIGTLGGCATAVIGGAAVGANAIANRRTIANINYDTWLTSKIRSKLLALGTSGVYPGHVKVVTFNSTAYVFGLLTPAQQTLVTNTVRTTAGIQQVVTLYENYYAPASAAEPAAPAQ